MFFYVSRLILILNSVSHSSLMEEKTYILTAQQTQLMLLWQTGN